TAHRLTHSERRGDRSVGRRERSHDRIANGLDHGAGLCSDNLVEDLEMRSYQVKGDQIANALVKFGGAFEIREEESQAGDFETLINIDRVSSVNIAKVLVCDQPL